MTKEFEKVNYQEVLNRVAEETGMTKADTNRFYRAFVEKTVEVVKEGKGVRFPRFFDIDLVVREAHEARNPATGEAVQVPAKVAAKLRTLKNLQEVTDVVKP